MKKLIKFYQSFSVLEQICLSAIVGIVGLIIYLIISEYSKPTYHPPQKNNLEIYDSIWDAGVSLAKSRTRELAALNVSDPNSLYIISVDAKKDELRNTIKLTLKYQARNYYGKMINGTLIVMARKDGYIYDVLQTK